MKKLILFLVLTFTAGSVYAQSVQLSTYYPSPFGMYDRLRLVPRAELLGACVGDEGTLYVRSSDTSLRFCGTGGVWGAFGGGIWTQNGNNLYPTDTANPNLRLGIGTTAPAANVNIRYEVVPLIQQDIFSITDSTNVSRLLAKKFASMNLQLQLNLGSAAEPSLGWLADATGNTGLFSGGEDIIGVATGGVERLRIDSTGNVGIGTTNPLYPFVVERSLSGMPNTCVLINTQAPAADTGTKVRIVGPSDITIGEFLGAWEGGATTDSYISLTTRGSNTITEKMRITSTGNVGIGTTAPTADLEVKDSGGLSQILVDGSVSAILHAGGPLAVELWLDQTGGGNTNRKLVSSGGALIFYSDVNEHMRITSSGNVGIGTTTPQSKLDVEGGMAVGATYSGTSAAPANGMIVEGNVGIGTTTPSQRLEVAGGAIKATGGLIMQTCAGSVGDPCPASPANGQMWLCTDATAPYCDGS